MQKKVEAYITKYHMIDPKDQVILGLSGGADSVCLFYLLVNLKKRLGFDLLAVHVNHCLRGEDAKEDEDYVENLCKKFQIPCKKVSVDVKTLSRERGLSLEEAGRDARRRVFEETASLYKYPKIALAHHMNDNAETMVLNIARGTGLKGLAGIRAVAGIYIRPLLSCSREEIEKYLEEQGFTYQTDFTNQEDDYARNRVRNHVLPYLKEEINDKTMEHMLQLSEQMEALDGYIERQIETLMQSGVESSVKGLGIKVPFLKGIDPVIRPYLIRRMIGTVAGREKDITAIHVKAVEELLEKQSGREVFLPYNLYAKRCFENICIERREVDQAIEGVWDVEMTTRLLESGEIIDIHEELPYTKWFDYDTIVDELVLRRKEPGDYLVIDEAGHKQKLKKYFINNKISLEQREQIPLVAEGSEILWIVGHRQSKRYQVTKETKRILEIQIHNYGGQNGREN